MQLATHHRLALGAAGLVSAIALNDAITHGLTGEWSVFADDSGVLWANVTSAIVHGLAYLAFLHVLAHEGRSIATANRFAALLLWVLRGSLALLAAGFLLVAPVLALLGSTSPDGVVGGVWSGLAGVGFLGMILGSLLLGPALLRTPSMRTGARVLTALLPVAGLTAGVAFVAPDWAHPAYVETTLHVGLALLGVDVVRRASGSARPVGEVGVLEHPGVHGDGGRG